MSEVKLIDETITLKIGNCFLSIKQSDIVHRRIMSSSDTRVNKLYLHEKVALDVNNL